MCIRDRHRYADITDDDPLVLVAIQHRLETCIGYRPGPVSFHELAKAVVERLVRKILGGKFAELVEHFHCQEQVALKSGHGGVPKVNPGIEISQRFTQTEFGQAGFEDLDRFRPGIGETVST